jgi:molybdopterin converting factor small subunit
VKIIGVLRTHLAKNAFSATLPEGGTVQDPIPRYRLPSNGVMTIIVNGQLGTAGTPLADGDSVTFFSLVRGW